MLLEPAGERGLHRFQVTGKKVIGAGEEHETFGIGSGSGYLRQLGGRGELVAVAAEKKLGDVAALQARIAVMMAAGLSGQAERGESAEIWTNLRVTTGLEGHGRAETEANGDEGALVFVFKPTESGEHVAGFRATVVRALAEARAAEVEAEDGKAKAPLRIVEGLHGVVNNFVVQIATVEGVRVADERGKRSVGSAFVQQGFETACGTG